jgi:putative transposase
LYNVSKELVAEAVEHGRSTIVFERLNGIRKRMPGAKKFRTWAFHCLFEFVSYKTEAAGIDTVGVKPAYTSKECHECGHIGNRPEQAELVCRNPECRVTEFQADISAAASIAKRLDPWGERCLWKSDSDDSSRDGSGCDTATRHPEQSAPTQMTLGAWSS